MEDIAFQQGDEARRAAGVPCSARRDLGRRWESRGWCAPSCSSWRHAADVFSWRSPGGPARLTPTSRNAVVIVFARARCGPRQDAPCAAARRVGRGTPQTRLTRQAVRTALARAAVKCSCMSRLASCAVESWGVAAKSQHGRDLASACNRALRRRCGAIPRRCHRHGLSRPAAAGPARATRLLRGGCDVVLSASGGWGVRVIARDAFAPAVRRHRLGESGVYAQNGGTAAGPGISMARAAQGLDVDRPRISSASDRSACLQHGRQPFAMNAVAARVGMDRVRLQVLVLKHVADHRRLVGHAEFPGDGGNRTGRVSISPGPGRSAPRRCRGPSPASPLHDVILACAGRGGRKKSLPPMQSRSSAAMLVQRRGKAGKACA